MNATVDDNTPGAAGDEDSRLLEEAVFDQADYDKLIAEGKITSAPLAVTARLTDWNGLTPAQEREEKEQRAQRSALAEAEYERTMADIRDRSDRLMVQLNAQEREIRKKMAEADARAIVLHDGRRVLVGEKDGAYIDEATGRTLDGADRDEAQGLRKTDSETAAEQKAHKDRLAQIDDAREHVRKAQALSHEDRKNLSPQEMKKREEQAGKELAVAETKAKGVEYVDVDANADMGAALGLPAPQARTASFAGTLDPKDSRSPALQGPFAASAQGRDAGALASSEPSSLGDKKTGVSAKQQLV